MPQIQTLVKRLSHDDIAVQIQACGQLCKQLAQSENAPLGAVVAAGDLIGEKAAELLAPVPPLDLRVFHGEIPITIRRRRSRLGRGRVTCTCTRATAKATTEAAGGAWPSAS